MKKNKKLLALVCCMALLVGSVGATLAWLTAESKTVTNTFTSAELFDNPIEEFTLWENEAVLKNDGTYELNSEKVEANTYNILPGVAIPKNPTVSVVSLKEYAYLYIKVEGDLPKGLTYSVDSAQWEPLAGYQKVWVYKGSNDTGNIIQAPATFDATILEGNKILVDDEFDGVLNGETLKFKAYMVQATGNGESAAEAWANTYGAVTP